MIKMYHSTDREYRKLANVRGDEQLYVAVSDGVLTGYCKYRTAPDRLVLLDLQEDSDNMMLADALVRATVAHYRDTFDTVECGNGGLLPDYRRYTGLYAHDSRERAEILLQRHCGLG